MKKIVIIGPESTGKSTLSDQLARHYNTIWIPEYAREFLSTLRRAYTYEDLLTIAEGQLKLEHRLTHAAAVEQSPAKSMVFIDTDMYVMKVWCEFVFDRCHHWIIDQIVKMQYDLYLLCNIDLPWTPDPLREYPAREPRERLYKMYTDIMINQSVPWVEISGDETARLKRAIDAVEKYCFTSDRVQ